MSATPNDYRRDPHGMTHEQKRALVLLEAASCPGVLTVDRTAMNGNQPWINYRTASALQRRGFVRIEGDSEEAEVHLS